MLKSKVSMKSIKRNKKLVKLPAVTNGHVEARTETKFKEGTESYSMLYDFVDTIQLIQNLLDPKRLLAKDLAKDSKGRIKVNITKPHILENMNFFRTAAISFEKTGKYTEAYPSKDPNSSYKKFWNEEKRRCKEGYVRKSDGEWVTGYYYYYLNYSPIMKTVIIGERAKDGSVEADRVQGFPDVWDGDYLFFHYVDQASSSGKYGVVLKSRGQGYSYKASAMLIRNYELYGRSVSYALAGDTEYLDTDGVLNKAWDYLDFANKHIGFAKKLRVKDTMMEKKAGYKKPGDPVEYGALSSIIGVTLKNSPGKARGKRGKLIIWEEAGIFPNLLKSWRIAQRSLEDGNRVFGFMLAFGTGGEKGANFEGLNAMFYSPEAYRILELPNVYDKNIKSQISGYFAPDYLNRADCYDKNGNSDVIKALEEIIEERLIIKYSGVKQEDIAQKKAEGALTPQEAVMQTEGSVFPTEELKEHLANVVPRLKSFTASHYIGHLIWVGHEQVEFKPDLSKVPVREWPVKDFNSPGIVELFELPKRVNGEVPSGRYIIGHDPVDDDYGSSATSTLIMDLLTDNIVGEWTGRFRTADQNFDLVYKMAVFYNAVINYENKLKGMFAYFDKRGALRFLADTPSILQDMDYVATKERYGNKKLGTPPTASINLWGRRLQADWMLSYSKYYDDITLKHIRSIGYVREAIAWNKDGNFDRISAGIMLFILRADKIKVFEDSKNNDKEVDDYNNDSFFTDGEFTDNYQIENEVYF